MHKWVLMSSRESEILPVTMSGPSLRLSNFPSFFPDQEKKICAKEEEQGTNDGFFRLSF